MRDIEAAKAVAQAWRAGESGDRATGGVVLVWESAVYGWKDELRDPGHERPGAVAVDAEGRAWIAEGGNDYDGAHRWTACGGAE